MPGCVRPDPAISDGKYRDMITRWWAYTEKGRSTERGKKQQGVSNAGSRFSCDSSPYERSSARGTSTNDRGGDRCEQHRQSRRWLSEKLAPRPVLSPRQLHGNGSLSLSWLLPSTTTPLRSVVILSECRAQPHHLLQFNPSLELALGVTTVAAGGATVDNLEVVAALWAEGRAHRHGLRQLQSGHIRRPSGPSVVAVGGGQVA